MGSPGGAGREHDHDRTIGVGLAGGRGGSPGSGQLVEHDRRFDRVGEQPLLGLGQLRVDPGRDRPELRRRAVGDQVVAAGWQSEGHHVTRCHALRHESAGDLVGAPVELGVGERRVPAVVGDGVTEASRGLTDDGVEHPGRLRAVRSRGSARAAASRTSLPRGRRSRREAHVAELDAVDGCGRPGDARRRWSRPVEGVLPGGEGGGGGGGGRGRRERGGGVDDWLSIREHIVRPELGSKMQMTKAAPDEAAGGRRRTGGMQPAVPSGIIVAWLAPREYHGRRLASLRGAEGDRRRI